MRRELKALSSKRSSAVLLSITETLILCLDSSKVRPVSLCHASLRGSVLNSSSRIAKECQAMLESMQESLPIDVLVVRVLFFSMIVRSLSDTCHPQGKKNVEVRPAHTNKGEIVQRLLYLHPETEFCMCAGDDKTDEDMVCLCSFFLHLLNS